MATLKIKHDRLRNGEFPADVITRIGLKVEISNSDKPFIDDVTITWDNSSNDMQIAYELGALVESSSKVYA